MEKLRPKGFPAITGLWSENMAHRVAVRYPVAGGFREGVFIWRRARFQIEDDADELRMRVQTDGGASDVSFHAAKAAWQPTPAFQTLPEISRFFERGACGYSCGRKGQELEGMQLKTEDWTVQPLTVKDLNTAFYTKHLQAEFDSALIMRNLAHECMRLPGRDDITALIGRAFGGTRWFRGCVPGRRATRRSVRCPCRSRRAGRCRICGGRCTSRKPL